MNLDNDICYSAISSRDPRFDGRFFTGVLSTGVYCRPICPARTPKLENCRFFACAAAASESGFRPCLRCRPEASPGAPAWLGTSATVSRALRLIAEGSLDHGSVAELASRLGVGARHLRRLFDLTAAPDEINRRLAGDSALRARVRANPGMRVPGAWDRFELAVRGILGQQITVQGATKLSGKLARVFGEKATNGLDKIFPSAEALAKADVARIGMPKARADAAMHLWSNKEG